jgi:hypothetical protein
MVIAMLHGDSATVKKFYRERDGRIRLQPANETMAPMYVHENDISIRGIVVGVMRRYRGGSVVVERGALRAPFALLEARGSSGRL